MRGRAQRQSSLRLKCVGKASLTQDGIGSVPTGNANGHREISLGDRAVPDFVTALALPYHSTTRRSQKIPQRPVELRRHSSAQRLGFAQGGDLQKQISRVETRMIVRQQIERH